MLLADGVLDNDRVAAITAYQQQHACEFGEAAERMGLVSREQLARARAESFGFPCPAPGDRSFDPSLDIAYYPSSPYSEALRSLRTDLLARSRHGANAFAVLSPERQDGRTRLIANLALAFSQTHRPTLLIDADLRKPGLHTLFKLGNNSGLSSILSGATDSAAVSKVPYFTSLTVIPSGPVPPNPQELLSGPVFGALLEAALHKYEIVLIDTSAASECSDWEAVARLARHAIVLARRGHTRKPRFDDLTRRLRLLDVEVASTLLLA